MTNFFLRRDPLNRSKALLEGAGLRLPCAIGRGGIKAQKREGDGATPRATLHPLQIFIRPDRWPTRRFALPSRITQPSFGWCDDIRSARYNRLVTLPFAHSHETLFRDDHVYDIIIETDWNVRPAIRGRGSAIFIHLVRPGLTPTEGCIALRKKDMILFLQHLTKETRIII